VNSAVQARYSDRRRSGVSGVNGAPVEDELAYTILHRLPRKNVSLSGSGPDELTARAPAMSPPLSPDRPQRVAEDSPEHPSHARSRLVYETRVGSR